MEGKKYGIRKTALGVGSVVIGILWLGVGNVLAEEEITFDDNGGENEFGSTGDSFVDTATIVLVEEGLEDGLAGQSDFELDENYEVILEDSEADEIGESGEKVVAGNSGVKVLNFNDVNEDLEKLIDSVEPSTILFDEGLSSEFGASNNDPSQLEEGDELEGESEKEKVSDWVEGDWVESIESYGGVKLVEFDVNSRGSQGLDTTLSFELMDGLKNNSVLHYGLRARFVNGPEYGVVERGFFRNGSMALETDEGVQVGTIYNGRIEFNHEVEDHIGSIVKVAIDNQHSFLLETLEDIKISERKRQLLTYDFLVADAPLKDNKPWYLLGTDSTERIVLPSSKRQSPANNHILIELGDGVLGYQVHQTVGGQPWEDRGINLWESPVTYRFELNPAFFGPFIPLDEVGGVGDFIRKESTDWRPVDVSEGVYAGIAYKLESDRQPSPRQIDPYTYEYDVIFPENYGNEVFYQISFGFAPIFDLSIIDMESLVFNEYVLIEMFQDGKLIGSNQIDRSEKGLMRLLDRSHISRASINVLEELEYRKETTHQLIPFDTVYRETFDLPEGERRVLILGKEGTKEVSERVLFRNNRRTETSVVESEEILKEPVDEVVEVGIGVVGEMITTETSTVSFETIECENPDLPEGERVVSQPGKPGVTEIVTKIPTLNGEPSGDPVLTEAVVEEPIPEIVEIGTGVVDEEISIVVKEVLFETIERVNSDLPEGETVMIQPGRPGVVEFMTTISMLNGQPTGEALVVTEVVIREAQSEIIEIGTGVTGEIVEEVVVPMEPTVEYRETTELAPGEERVVETGRPGEKVVTTTTPTLNGEPSGEPVVTEVVTKEPSVTIVEVGVEPECEPGDDGSVKDGAGEVPVDMPFGDDVGEPGDDSENELLPHEGRPGDDVSESEGTISDSERVEEESVELSQKDSSLIRAFQPLHVSAAERIDDGDDSELPFTGEASSVFGVLGLSHLFTGFGLLGGRRRKEKK